MHAWVSYTSADTHSCRLHQEPLDLLPGVFHVQTLRHKLHWLERVVFVRSILYLYNCPKQAPCSSLCGLEALTAFADSKRSHCKWIPNDSKPLLKLIRRDAFSANITIVHGIGCSLNLNIDLIIVLLFFGSMGLVWVWFAEYGQAIDWQTLPHVWPSAATKSPNFWAGPK